MGVCIRTYAILGGNHSDLHPTVTILTLRLLSIAVRNAIRLLEAPEQQLISCVSAREFSHLDTMSLPRLHPTGQLALSTNEKTLHVASLTAFELCVYD